MIYMRTQWYSEILNMNYTAHHGVKRHSHRTKNHKLWLLTPMEDIFVLIFIEAKYPYRILIRRCHMQAAKAITG